MSRTDHHALRLLERALGYTRVALSTVGPDRSARTPCAGWSLGDLLSHMDDGLDAFVEAAGGDVLVPAEASAGAGGDLELLQLKACALLGRWSGPAPAVVLVGGRPVPSSLLVRAAALEIAVHGWDVGRSTGAHLDLPDDLATALMPVAHAVVLPEDRPDRFGAPLRSGVDAAPAEVLLGYLGRSTHAATAPS